MRHLPKVMVGGPVRDRAWSIPIWMGGLLGLDYPRRKLTLAALVNDSADLTLEACLLWGRMAQASSEFGDAPFDRVRIEERDFGTTADNTIRDLGVRDMMAFGRARDAWVELLPDDCEWLLQVDSDIDVPPHLLSGLLERAVKHDLKMLAAFIANNVGTAMHNGNVCNYRRLDVPLFHEGLPTGETERRRLLAWPQEVWSDRSDRVVPCDMTGACVLLHRSIFDAGIRYTVPAVVEVGSEDAPFCDALASIGVRPHAAPAIRATHYMQAPEDVAYVNDPAHHRRLATYHRQMTDLLSPGNGQWAMGNGNGERHGA